MKKNELTIESTSEKVNFPELEHKVLDYWDSIHAFERSVSERPGDKRYVFYDGPPFATGLPHYGHILSSTSKDVIPRYWTMKGYKVERVWGWDCHGIPIENMIEKELGLKGGKKGIEEMGIDKFNAACKAAILRFDKEWEKVIRRIGRWVDFKNSYKTMDTTYMESVWWAFKSLYDKGLVYEGRKVILYCPRCATPLSNFEIAMDNSYKDVEDFSVYVKFARTDVPREYFLAWTTTPWTLIGNVALAVDPKATYVKLDDGETKYWLAQTLVEKVFQDKKVTLVETKKGSELVGLSYVPLYQYMPLEGKKAHYVAEADFVSLDDGTGIVHTAAIFGEDDYRLAVALDLPRVPTLDDQGKFLDFVTPLVGVFYKKAEQWIVDDLTGRSLMFRAEKTRHSYPFCYRCETPLYYNAVPAWFIDIQSMKKDMARANEPINWYPEHLKYGRFGKGLETAPDWNISRSRYWGTPMPVWRGVNIKTKNVQMRMIGSLAELKKWAVEPKQVDNLTDIHREFLDDLEVWVDDAKTIKGTRIPEVFDCWVESGSMPYAAIHYPFEQKEVFEQTHPAQFITEYIAQTRAWFYTLHVMSVGLFGRNTFENALTTGTILAEDGTKMSKSKKNYPDPSILFEKYGVDALRFYLMGSVVMKGENLNFSEKGVSEVYQRVVTLLWNTFSFYRLYDDALKPELPKKLTHELDIWIVSKTSHLISDVTRSLDAYDTVATCRLIGEFIDELSTWYLRRSRERFKADPKSMSVFGWVLRQLVLVMAPVTPFIAEVLYQNMPHDKDSVHLEAWPEANTALQNASVEQAVALSRVVVEGLHALRKESALPIKQPLGIWSFTAAKQSQLLKMHKDIFESVREECNLKSFSESLTPSQDGVKTQTIQHKDFGEVVVYLDTTLTPELVSERKARELVRAIQGLRKEAKVAVSHRIKVQIPTEYKELSKDLLAKVKADTVASDLVWGESLTLLIGS